MPKYFDERGVEWRRLFPAHLKEPDVSLALHMSRRKRELAQFVLRTRRVYLDTRFWIHLRDTSLGRETSENSRRLLNLLRRGVREGIVLCPLGDAAYLELLNQGDRSTRMATVRMMDELSQGVVIQNTPDRVRTELFSFIVEAVDQGALLDPPRERIWLKVGHVLGTGVPASEDWTEEEQLAAQKTVADVMWSLTLEEMLTDTPLPRDLRDENKEAAARISARSAEHQHEMGSFKQVYLSEIAGFWDAYEDCIRETLEEMFRRATGNQDPIPTDQVDAQVHRWKNALHNIVKFNKVETALPTAQVVSSLHAIVRWNKTRDFQGGDFADFHHAAAAIPYCDVFLTERFLAHILSVPPVSLTERFNTDVSADVDEALEVVADLIAAA